MLRYGFFAIGLCLLVTSASSQSGTTPAPNPQSADQKALLQQKLNSEFKLTRMTADKSDVVTAGSVLVLQKDGLVMTSVDTSVPPTSTYKNGKVSLGFGADLAWSMQLGKSSSEVPQRKFVAGEKFWITSFTVQEDGLIFKFYSDPYQDVRYYGQLKFPFPKHVMPQVDEVMKTIAEVLTVQPDDNAAASAPQPQSGGGLAPREGSGLAPQQQSALTPPPQQAMAPIAPPPPPPDAPPPQPKTISLGQTKDQVVAIFGQPQRVANLGTKEIDYYPDMKVTYMRGKVTDVQ